MLLALFLAVKLKENISRYKISDLSLKPMSGNVFCSVNSAATVMLV
jgi:hypothetical protein